jgi:hypothetical protein
MGDDESRRPMASEQRYATRVFVSLLAAQAPSDGRRRRRRVMSVLARG